MRKFCYLLLLPVLLLSGCASFQQPPPQQINQLYYEQIKDWQNRINKEGWGKNIIDEVIEKCIMLSKYRVEKTDHWDTPKEFMDRGLQGDCEDIAVFMMATLKRINYPYNVRVVAVKTWRKDWDHALLKVEMPDGEWKNYETIPLPFQMIDQMFYRPIVEFDDKNIIYYAQSYQLTHP